MFGRLGLALAPVSATVTPGMWIVSLTIVASLWWRGGASRSSGSSSRSTARGDLISRAALNLRGGAAQAC